MHRRRRVWQCKRCGGQTSVTAGTVMHGTRMGLQLWFWAAYLVATHHPGISAVQLQRQLGIGCHETAWMMLHKLRRAMVAAEREPLEGEAEVDEFYLGGLDERRGRERGKKTPVGVAIEVRGRGSGRLRLQVLADASQRTLTELISAHVASGSVVHSDGWPGYAKLTDAGYDHRPCLQRRDHRDAQKLLPRAHRAASNLKTWLHGTHRHPSPEHLCAYLDEYVRHEALSDRVGCKTPTLGRRSGLVKLRAA